MPMSQIPPFASQHMKEKIKGTEKKSSVATWGKWTASASQRLDLFLAEQKEIKSRSSAQKLIREGRIQVNGKMVRQPSRTLHEDDQVTLMQSEAVATGAFNKTSRTVEVLYEDDNCMVINKPAGLIVHPGAGVKADTITLLDILRSMFSKQSLPFSATEVLVHRLDKDTTGCLLIAKNPEAHLKLQKLFQTRSIRKTYLALVHGIPSPADAIIDSPIGRHRHIRTKMSVTNMSVAREAVTVYATLAATKGCSSTAGIGIKDSCALLSCDLQTGRTHQIRVHLTSIGHPILGDATYNTAASQKFSKLNNIDQLCLHAWKLEFVSPFSTKKIIIQAPMPVTMKSYVKELLD